MHEKGGYKAEDIKEKPYQKLINETYKTFQSAITDNDIPPVMLAKLQNDTFIFSGLRTHAQLLEASSFLRDEKGQIRNYDSFAHQFNQVNKNYNQNYLEAEWQFAVNSSQSAANWATLDSNGRYNLQYRTANDDRVRADHAALQNITLPVDDSFWLSYYPPNGWRCRCTAVEVLKTKYQLSDSAKSNELGDRATTKIGPDGKNRMEIFRFNPGAEQKVFPPKHPYNKIEGANKIKELVKMEMEFTNISLGEFEKLYEQQKLNRENEKIVMNGNTGYIATSNSFYLNSKLREKESLEDDDKKTIKALDSLIKENTLSKNIYLYRNVGNDFIRTYFDFYNPLLTNSETIQRMKEANVKSYSDPAYSSTSAIEKANVFQNRKFQLQIRAKAGTNVYVTENIVESEIILGRNQKFNLIDIVEISNERIRIVVETD